MNTGQRLSRCSPIGNDWATWVDTLALRTAGDHMAAHQLCNGYPAGEWPLDCPPRVYLALSQEGRCLYVGKTRTTLQARLAGHRGTGMSRRWAWLVFVTVPDVGAAQLSHLEGAAADFFLPPSARAGRRHPRAGLHLRRPAPAIASSTLA